MEISKYLIITPKFRYSRSRPSGAEIRLISSLSESKMASNAVAIKLNFDLPDAMFVKPQLQASIKVPADKVSQPIIDANVLDNIKETIEKQTGLEITLNLVDQRLD